ncbi:hypothetical protein HKD37_15G043786 [Glycine soja]
MSRLFRSFCCISFRSNSSSFSSTTNSPKNTNYFNEQDNQTHEVNPKHKLFDEEQTLRKDFYSPENEPQRRWFVQHFKGPNRKQIQEKFYEFVERVKINVLFFDWFHAYTIKENIDYSWQQDIIGDPTTNTIWQIKDGEMIQSELPPTTQFQLPKIKDSNERPLWPTSEEVTETETSSSTPSDENLNISPTQVGSSTQKTKIEGSSTQIISVKPESSPQESSKPATAKQTSADYAWSIQTLQALQEMGLTKFPKIIKKSWADIASESDNDSETNLQKMIQDVSMPKIVINPKGKQTLAKTQTPTTKQTNNYIYKNKFSIVLQMELEFWDKNPFKATAKAFPTGFHFKPTAINNSRTLYELILVDSNSVSIKHFKDPKDQTLNTHSTIQILKVLQPRHFGSDLNKGKKILVPFDPIGYTYWDYVDAWTKFFWHQNTRFKHSWLIYFKTNTIYNFPNWFLQWWDFFGLILEIFLEQRHAFVKCWAQFDTSKADPEQVKLWFQSHPEFLKAADPETSVFLNQKSHLAAFLAGSKSKESLTKNLKEVLQMLQQEEKGSSSKKEETSSTEEEEEDLFYQNEDDCFGICLDNN